MPGLLLILLLASSAMAGQLKTLDGKTHDGDLKLDADAIIVAPRRGTPVTIPLAQILSAQFKTPPPDPDPPHWQARDIGNPAAQGSATRTRDGYTIRGGGTDMVTGKDQFYFVHQPLAGDGQIVAKIASVSRSDPQAIAALTFRSSTDPGAPCAAVMAFPDGSVAFAIRIKPNTPPTIHRAADAKGPWLRLTRKGKIISAYASEDGLDWTPIATEGINFPPQTLAGLAVCARNANTTCNAVFENPAITPGIVKERANAFRGVVLRDGTSIAAKVHSATSSAVRIDRDRERNLTVPLTEVARLHLAPMPPDMNSKLQGGRPGAILSSGDVFEGELTGIEAGHVKIQSVLFGVRQFKPDQVLAVVLRDLAPSSANFEVRCVDGSVLYADKLTLQRNLLTVSTPAGAIDLVAAELFEINAGPRRPATQPTTAASPTPAPGSRSTDDK